MSVIAVISPKGGVGKTTVTVNLASILAGKRHLCRLIDLDPQNALRLHMGATLGDTNGLVHQSLQHQSWSRAEYETADGVRFIPYGKVSERERVAFELQLAQNPHWLKDNIGRLGSEPGTLTILDTPPGPSVYAQQVLSVADLALVVMIPDAGSYATLGSIEDLLQYYCGDRTDFMGSYYLLNQFNAAVPLNRDIRVAMQDILGERLAPYCIHRDESLSEALAFQQTVRHYAPHSQAADDLEHLAVWLTGLLNKSSAQSFPRWR